MTRLDAGYRIQDVDGSRLSGIPSAPTPQVVIPGPVRRTANSALPVPRSLRYMGGHARRYTLPPVQGIGNLERNVLPADIWIVGNRYNATAVYRPPIAIANPTWRINNVTNKDIGAIKKLQERKRGS